MNIFSDRKPTSLLTSGLQAIESIDSRSLKIMSRSVYFTGQIILNSNI
ncbi:hypothetical protein RintRC_1989 [Richelia intracellularis]|nr:hypothetical protein RintRC_1989 [Richelia intracellularis]